MRKIDAGDGLYPSVNVCVLKTSRLLIRRSYERKAANGNKRQKFSFELEDFESSQYHKN